MLFGIFFLLGLPAILVTVECMGYLAAGKPCLPVWLRRLTEIGALIILPLMYGNFGVENNCCGDELSTAVFAPDHQLSILVIIAIALSSYYYSVFRKTIFSPLLEVFVSVGLWLGILLNGFIAYHTNFIGYALGGNYPIIVLGLLMFYKNHQLFLQTYQAPDQLSGWQAWAWKLLQQPVWIKIPALLVLAIPLLSLLVSLLLLFGQKPDSFIRAFTDTYKHGFSQLDYECLNVSCGGHFLCSVAAMGTPALVKPTRKGWRHGNPIQCNRQLLIANAFEDWLMEKFPTTHHLLRTQYNRVGKLIHAYYGVFERTWVSNLVYVFMKPLEYFFLICLYLFDRFPERRIAMQYLETSHQQLLRQLIHHYDSPATRNLPPPSHPTHG